MNTITVIELKNKLSSDQKSLLIDVRSPESYKACHIPKAINIPTASLAKHLEKLKEYEEIYLQCNSGNQSGIAQKLLESFGITNTYNVIGGLQDWIKIGNITKSKN